MIQIPVPEIHCAWGACNLCEWDAEHTKVNRTRSNERNAHKINNCSLDKYSETCVDIIEEIYSS